jgi:hypothetical protein
MVEPEFTRQFSNATVCNFFYIVSLVILALGSIPLLFKGLPGLVMALSSGKSSSIMVNLLAVALQAGILAFGVFVYLFISVICSRCLLDKDTAQI